MLFYLLYKLICAVCCGRIGVKKGYGRNMCQLVGLIFGIIGVIIIYFIQSKNSSQNIQYSAADELRKYKDLLDAGAISEDEYNQKKNKILGIK